MEIPKVVEVHVGAGVEGPERTVQRQGAFGIALFDALAHLHLHEVAGRYELLGFQHRLQIIFFFEVTFCRIGLR